jgi:hypothetical protein
MNFHTKDSIFSEVNVLIVEHLFLRFRLNSPEKVEEKLR